MLAGEASGRRQIEPGHHPQTARLLDSDPGTEILRQGAQASQPVALLCHLQIEYCRNFVFKRNFPISINCSSAAANSACVGGSPPTRLPDSGTRLNRRMQGKLATVIDRIEHGHHVFRAYFKHAFLKQYEMPRTFLRNAFAPTTSPTSVCGY